MLTGSNQQIITAFEDLSMTPEQISGEFDLDLLSVKACLMQFSSKFRDDLKIDKTLDFRDTELEEANSVILSIMRCSEDDHLRGRMARYIRDDKKGRLDVLNGLGKMNININLFNQRLVNARKSKELSKSNNDKIAQSSSKSGVIDIESEKVAA